MSQVSFQESPVAKFLLSDTRAAFLWLPIRLYVGWAWLTAGWSKLNNPAWVGSGTGQSLSGFIAKAVAKATGEHPDVSLWYANFLQTVVLDNVETWSVVVATGEFLVGLGLLLGLFTGVAAFFGLMMNFNFMLAGSLSTNPILLVLSVGLVLAWRVVGQLGLDRFVLPVLGTPWQPGRWFRQS